MPLFFRGGASTFFAAPSRENSILLRNAAQSPDFAFLLVIQPKVALVWSCHQPLLLARIPLPEAAADASGAFACGHWNDDSRRFLLATESGKCFAFQLQAAPPAYMPSAALYSFPEHLDCSRFQVVPIWSRQFSPNSKLASFRENLLDLSSCSPTKPSIICCSWRKDSAEEKPITIFPPHSISEMRYFASTDVAIWRSAGDALLIKKSASQSQLGWNGVHVTTGCLAFCASNDRIYAITASELRCFSLQNLRLLWSHPIIAAAREDCSISASPDGLDIAVCVGTKIQLISYLGDVSATISISLSSFFLFFSPSCISLLAIPRMDANRCVRFSLDRLVIGCRGLLMGERSVIVHRQIYPIESLSEPLVEAVSTDTLPQTFSPIRFASFSFEKNKIFIASFHAFGLYCLTFKRWKFPVPHPQSLTVTNTAVWVGEAFVAVPLISLTNGKREVRFYTSTTGKMVQQSSLALDCQILSMASFEDFFGILDLNGTFHLHRVSPSAHSTTCLIIAIFSVPLPLAYCPLVVPVSMAFYVRSEAKIFISQSGICSEHSIAQDQCKDVRVLNDCSYFVSCDSFATAFYQSRSTVSFLIGSENTHLAGESGASFPFFVDCKTGSATFISQSEDDRLRFKENFRFLSATPNLIENNSALFGTLIANCNDSVSALERLLNNCSKHTTKGSLDSLGLEVVAEIEKSPQKHRLLLRVLRKGDEINRWKGLLSVFGLDALALFEKFWEAKDFGYCVSTLRILRDFPEASELDLRDCCLRLLRHFQQTENQQMEREILLFIFKSLPKLNLELTEERECVTKSQIDGCRKELNGRVELEALIAQQVPLPQ